MIELVNVGHDTYIQPKYVCTVMRAATAPAVRLVKRATEDGMVLDGTFGKRTRSVIVLYTGQVVLSSLRPATVKARLQGETALEEEEGT